MSKHGGLLWVVTLLFSLFLAAETSWAMSPRYTLVGLAQVEAIEGPNLLRVRLKGQNRVITVRLLGVGSPRNRERIRTLEREVVSYILKNDLWEASRDYVRSLVKERTVEVWARKWDRLDEKNRLLAYLMIPKGQEEPVDVNGEIIKSGLGLVTRDYVHVRFAGYRLLERDARKNRRGIWRALSLGRVSSLRD